MIEDNIHRMYLYLEGSLEEAQAKELEEQINNDEKVAAEWKSFLVEQHLADNLPEEWKMKFENLRKASPEFEEEIDFQKEVQEKLRTIANENLKSELHNLLPKEDLYVAHKRKNKSKNKYILYAVAASIALLVSLYIFKPQPLNNQELYSQYFEPYPMLLAQRSDDQIDLERLATEAYQKEDYEVALQHFSSLLSNSPTKPEYLLYAGISALETAKTKKARSYLMHINSETFKEQRDWYIALSWLKDEETERAKVALEVIVKNPDNYYNSKAKDLHNKLD